MTKKYFLAGFILIMAFTAISAKAAESDYQMIAGVTESKTLCYFSISSSGQIKMSGSYDMGRDLSKFIDPRNIIISKGGQYVALYDFPYETGAIYSVNPKGQLGFMAEITGGFSGAGFSEDGKFMFTTSGIHKSPPKPKIDVYRTSGTLISLVASQEVPTTASLCRDIFSDAKDELLASANNGSLDAPPSIIVYQFNRERLHLDVKQYLPMRSDIYNNSAMDFQRRIYVYARGAVGSIVKEPDGLWSEKTYFTGPPEAPNWARTGANAAQVTPDAKFAVAAVFYDDSDVALGKGGLTLFEVKEDGSLEYASIAPRRATCSLAMTPDGQYFVASYILDNEMNYGNHEYLGVFWLDRRSKSLLEVSTIPITGGRMATMAFFPQFGPKAASDERWMIYE